MLTEYEFVSGQRDWVKDKIKEVVENNEPLEVLQYWINMENELGQRMVDLEVKS